MGWLDTAEDKFLPLSAILPQYCYSAGVVGEVLNYPVT